MPSSCCAINCTNRQSKKTSLSFFDFRQILSEDDDGLQQFLALDGSLMMDLGYVVYILFQRNQPKWKVTLIMYHQYFFSKTKPSTTQSRIRRYQRLIHRRKLALTSRQQRTCENDAIFVGGDSNVQETVEVSEQPDISSDDAATEQIIIGGTSNSGMHTEVDISFEHNYALQSNSIQSDDTGESTVTENGNAVVVGDGGSNRDLEKIILEQDVLILVLQKEYWELLKKCSPSQRLVGDDGQTRYYTGLPSYKVFEHLVDKFTLVSPTYTRYGLPAADQLLMVMMKLRHATTHKDLGYQFGVHVSRVSKIFHHWIDIMSRELQQLISWPDHELVHETLPDCFKPKYTRTKCIIDCSEVFIQRSTSLSARAETYSNYKSHNTIKFLVAISPTGALIFVSKCWGGRVSDKQLTSLCGFLEKLTHGDLVLADSGFHISDELALYGATLAIPPFTKGKPQLSQRDVEESRSLSRVRIHVERAIGRLKTYKILHSTLPITLVKRPYEKSYATIDKILIVCSALCNLHPPLI